jgi:hypothetical protein
VEGVQLVELAVVELDVSLPAVLPTELVVSVVDVLVTSSVGKVGVIA